MKGILSTPGQDVPDFTNIDRLLQELTRLSGMRQTIRAAVLKIENMTFELQSLRAALKGALGEKVEVEE